MEEWNLVAAELIRNVRLLQQQVESLRGERLTVTLTAEQRCVPVAFQKIRPESDYYVHTAVLEKRGGTAGEIEIAMRQRNGFFISYDGTAEALVLDLWIHD